MRIVTYSKFNPSKNADETFYLQDKIRLLQDDLESERELRQRVSQSLYRTKIFFSILNDMF